MAKQTYEAGFMAFLGTKFSSEYVNSPDGKVAAEMKKRFDELMMNKTAK